MRVGFKLIISFFFVLIALLAALSFWHTTITHVPTVLISKDNLQDNTFGEFMGVNSVREPRKNWIEDQYSVVSQHRVFGMDSYLFTGEEIVTDIKGAFFKVDRSIQHDEYPNDSMGFSPAKGANGFDFDDFLVKMNKYGYKTIPVLARNLLYTNVPDDSVINVWQIPYDTGGDAENPMSYKAFASFLFQFTARYGSNKVIREGGSIDPKLLKVIASNEVKAGLNVLFAIEPGNEMDRQWFSDKEYASPKELAAFLSAAIDGHMGKMGPGHGILAADSSMKILLPSPTDIKYGYVSDVLENLKKLRNNAESLGRKVIPIENLILTAHAYPFNENTVAETSTIIEQTSIFKKSYKFIKKLRETYGCPIYLTETGYDKVTGLRSPIGVPVNELDTIDEHDIGAHAQAKHILRLLFTTYAAGYDKTFLFTLKDPVLVGGKNYRTKFATTGLVRKNGKKDLAWYEIKFITEKLKDYKLTFAYLNQPVNFLKLEHKNQIAYVYWSGTNSGKSYQFQLPVQSNDIQEAELIKLAQKSDGHCFDVKCMKVQNNLSLEINEFPQLLLITK